jgi:Cu/Ag efflux protein CusF
LSGGDGIGSLPTRSSRWWCAQFIDKEFGSWLGSSGGPVRPAGKGFFAGLFYLQNYSMDGRKRKDSAMGTKRTWVLISLSLISTWGAALTAAEKQAQIPEMHHPRGWRFTMPKGDVDKGREVFNKYVCHVCHEVRGEDFPPGSRAGPELSQMGPLHPLEYFTESTINPSAQAAKKHRSPDGKSTMPDYNERMTVQELIDLSTYLAELKPKGVPGTVTGEGRILAVVAETKEVVIEHGEIKGFMDAMTMGYKVSSTSLLRSVKSGDKVRFTIDTNKHTITKIEKLNN